MLILRAALDVVEVDGFDESLQKVRDRIDEIESLHRTAELTVCPNLCSSHRVLSALVSSLKMSRKATGFGCPLIKVGHDW